MKILHISLIPVVLMLAGCPGIGYRIAYAEWGWISVTPEKVCYSIDKKDVISTYFLESHQGFETTDLLNSGMEDVSLSYPDSCFYIKLKTGYKYWSSYTINGNRYRYNFFIDNNWNVISLEGTH